MKRIIFSITLALFFHVLFGLGFSKGLYCAQDVVDYPPLARENPIHLFIYGSEIEYYGHVFDDCKCRCGKSSNVVYICTQGMYAFCDKHAPKKEKAIKKLLKD